MKQKLEKAVEIVGGQTKLSKLLGVSQPRVWNWINRDKQVPAQFVHEICDATGNRIKPHELRPDVFHNSPS